MLRTTFPQFAQRSRESNAPAQQDAEECWSQILNNLRTNVKAAPQESSFVDVFLAGQMQSTLVCDETTEEPPITTTESFLKLNCHIGVTTNFMADGILAALSEKIEKNSEILGRNVSWTKTSRITRLPKYLVVHFVRFYWKRDSNKKAKILRKVKFSLELDASQFCSDDLKAKTLPVRDALRESRKRFEEAERARKRARVQAEVDAASGTTAPTIERESAVEEIDPESLIDSTLKADVGSNPSGIYELAGVLTHAGSNADSGHWIGWTKQSQGEDWWKFDDNKVSSVPESKILNLDGGGEADTACSTPVPWDVC
jgi:ubiquitin carboxyl-terminal hydrolase 14